MSLKGSHHDVALGNLLDDIPTLDEVRLEGGFFAGVDRGEWIRNLEHHFRYGEDLLMLWSEPGIGKSALLTQLATRLDPNVYAVVTMDARRGGSAEHLWGALDRRLSLPHGAEGWDALKRTAKKMAMSGQSLAIIIDHADKLNKEAVQLLRAMLDVHLPECRFVLALDGQGVSAQGQWPHVEAMLFEKGQLARLWPFAEEDALSYLDFRIQHAQLGDVILTDKQKQTIYARSEGNAGLIKAELQRLLSAGELLGKPKLGKKPAAVPVAKKKPTKPAPNLPQSEQRAKTKKKAPVLPKAHTVAMSVLAVALLGFYLVWEQPIPSSVIPTPSPMAQQMAPVIKTLDESALPFTAQIENEPPASGMSSPNNLDANAEGDLAASDSDASATAPAAEGALGSGTHMQPPVGFVPSNVPLMATQSSHKPTAKESVTQQPQKSATQKLVSKKTEATTIVGSDLSESERTSSKVAAKLPVAQSKPLDASPAIKSKADVAGQPKSVANAEPKPKTTLTSPPPALVALPVEAEKPAVKPVVVAKATPTVRKSAYTLQIMGLRDVRSVQAFMQRNAAVKGLRYHTTSLNGQPWYVIVQGEYPSRQAAQAAVKSLPAALQATKPFPKNTAALQ